MAEVTIRYWAAAKEAAGLREESVEAETVQDALDAVLAGRPDGRLREVLSRSSFLLDATRVNRVAAGDVKLIDGSVLEILPPFAGG
jgi:molybdopterin converting factor small subunit